MDFNAKTEETSVNSPEEAQDSGITPFSVLAGAVLVQPPVPGAVEEGEIERGAR